MAHRRLPDSPSLTSLKYEAKQLLRSHKAQERKACEVLRLHTRLRELTDGDILGTPVSLMEVQHALALSYGFTEWTTLRDHVESVPSPPELSPEAVRGSLQRVLRGGRLRALPKRRRDRLALLAIAASCLPEGESDEATTTDRLRSWLEPFVDPRAFDHVQLRRALVDYGFLHRTPGGRAYWPDREVIVSIVGVGVRADEPARILEATERSREARKRAYAERQT